MGSVAVLINVLTFITDLSRIAMAEEKFLFTKSLIRKESKSSFSFLNLIESG